MTTESVPTGSESDGAAAAGGPAAVAGIDVGKRWLDAHLEPGGRARRFLNDRRGCRALRGWLRRHGVGRAVFEPTGRCHRCLHQCLAAAGLETVAVRPALRRGARQAGAGQDRSRGRRGAGALRASGGLGSDPAAGRAAVAALQDLVLARRRFVDERAALDRRVKALDKVLLEAVAADPGLRRRAEVLRSVPGVGPAAGPVGCCIWPLSLQPVPGRLLPATPRARQAARGGPGRRHAQAGRAGRRPAPRGPPLAACPAPRRGVRMRHQSCEHSRKSPLTSKLERTPPPTPYLPTER